MEDQTEQHQKWWQQLKIHPVRTVFIAFLAVVILLTILSIIGYISNWDWVGLGPYVSPPHSTDSDFQRGKTLWDWLQLLIIPAVLVVAGYIINLTISRSEQEATKQHDKTEREIALDNQRDAALQAYIDKMSELLLEKKLRNSAEVEVRKIARVRTLRVLPRLDCERKRNVIQFLHESGLIYKDDPIIDLHEADLRKASLDLADLIEANLSGAKLMGANLEEARLMKVNLDGANLSVFKDPKTKKLINTDLSGTDLSEAILFNANFEGANLEGANLNKAWVTREQLAKAKSLKDATMPDGSIHP